MLGVDQLAQARRDPAAAMAIGGDWTVPTMLAHGLTVNEVKKKWQNVPVVS